MTATELARPLLIFDGECDLCRAWVDYWQRLTDDRVDYEPRQTAAERFPAIPRVNFERAVHLVTPAGQVFRGAEAVLQLLALAPGQGGWLWLYRRVPGTAAIAEWLYRIVADHRDFFYRAADLAWGIPLEPPTYTLVRALFLRALGLIYFVAFTSWAGQARGLVGANGILPAADFLARVYQRWGAQSYALAPTLFWFNASDAFLQALPFIGALLALLLAAGIEHWSVRLALYAGYLSLVWAGQDFMAFQWDNLLLEAGFLAVWLDAALPAGIWLGRWLVFRLMFLSGAAKLLSGDPTWRFLTALNYHYQTQPLPTVLGWFAHHLPDWLQRASVLGMFVIELAVPFLFFAPRRARFLGAALTVSLQLLILLTGNYTFFNWLAIVVCLFLLDDRALRRLPGRLRAALARAGGRVADSRVNRTAVGVMAALLMGVSGLNLAQALGVPLPEPATAAVRALRPFRLTNNYGLFATLTVWRGEIIIEGSNDGQTWLEYGFQYKPGDLQRAPRWVAPFQPRLDWQMWFAALGAYRQNQWFINLMLRLLQGQPEVLALMGTNPFPDAPPRYIRALLYSYEFTDLATLRATGEWWRRETVAEYFPEAQLAPQ